MLLSAQPIVLGLTTTSQSGAVMVRAKRRVCVCKGRVRRNFTFVFRKNKNMLNVLFHIFLLICHF